MRTRAWLGCLLLSACAAPPAWSPVDVGAAPVTLTAVGERILVGTAAGSGLPGLTWLGPDGALSPATTTATSGYAVDARWLQVAARNGRLVALAGARGGAHANVRWTLWQGDADGLAEDPQPFETFGGWGAGALTGVALPDSGPLILGSWQSAAAGLEPTLWRLRPDGRTAQRIPSTGTALANDRLTLHQGHGLAAGEGLAVIAGSTTHLADPITVTPTVWVTVGSAPWHSYEVPAPAPGSADAVGCGIRTCLALGNVGGVLHAWSVDASGVRDVAAPGLPLSPDAALTPPALVGDQAWVAIPTTTGTRLFRWDGATWAEEPGPPGTPVALAATTAGVWVIGSRDGRSTLWRADG